MPGNRRIGRASSMRPRVGDVKAAGTRTPSVTSGEPATVDEGACLEAPHPAQIADARANHARARTTLLCPLLTTVPCALYTRAARSHSRAMRSRTTLTAVALA